MQNIRSVSLNSIIEFLEKNGEKPYRANQISDWLWKYRVSSFDKMKNLSLNLQEILSKNFFIDAAKITTQQFSDDNTIKVAFTLFDNQAVEGVLIPSDKRVTACISSQVGCALGCKFCATGQFGFSRNLSAGEIYDQAFLLAELSQKQYDLPLTNIVFMGMGEPLLNYENVILAINWITSQKGMGFSTKRITISTAGIPDKIEQLAKDNIKVNLALSLHTAIPTVRQELLPVANKYTLERIAQALKFYTSTLKKEVTFEYLLLKGINDSLNDAKALINYCSHVASKVNVIEYNPVTNLPFEKSTPENTALFLKTLFAKNLNVKLRQSRGKDIDAACGQLANKERNT
jgi:23S rRNA (adenine2503-C2)-methyltransferase